MPKSKTIIGRPKLKEIREDRFAFRLTKKEAARVRASCRIYADGDISAWIRYCLMNCRPKFLTAEARKPLKPKTA